MEKYSEKGFSRTKWMAQIHDGHSFIERRVFEDKRGFRWVRINGHFVGCDFLTGHMNYKVDYWF